MPGIRRGRQREVMHMNDRGLSEEQRMMRQSCRDFVDEVVLPFIRENWQREWSMEPEDRLPPRILEEAEKIGIRTLGVPEEFGGVELEKGTEVKTFALIAEEIARGDSASPTSWCKTGRCRCCCASSRRSHLQEKWFPELVKNPQFLMAHCLTEPRGASDRWLPYNVPEAAMQTKAVKADGGWVINGRKQFISNGYDASLYVVYANTNPKVGMLQGTSSFLVPRETKGFSVARCNETLGCRFMNNGEMVFEDMFIPDDHLLVQDTAHGIGRCLFPSRQDHPGGEESRRRRARLRGGGRLCAELRAGRPHSDQASGGGAAARRDGDQDRGGARAHRTRGAGGRRQCAGSGDAGQHGQDVRI